MTVFFFLAVRKGNGHAKIRALDLLVFWFLQINKTLNPGILFLKLRCCCHSVILVPSMEVSPLLHLKLEYSFWFLIIQNLRPGKTAACSTVHENFKSSSAFHAIYIKWSIRPGDSSLLHYSAEEERLSSY